MPITGFLKIEEIPGESQRAGHEDEIDVHDMRWGLERTAGATIGRGRARARANVQPLVIYKHFDAASPYLAKALHQGQAFKKIVLSVRKESGGAHLDYLVITMENVAITSYELASSQDDIVDTQLEEEVEFDFERISILYRQMNDDGSVGAEHEVDISERF